MWLIWVNISKLNIMKTFQVEFKNNTLNVSYLPPYKVQKKQINFFLLKT